LKKLYFPESREEPLIEKKNLRNNLAVRASKTPSPNPVLQLESINSSAVLQQQTNTLETLKANDFKVREKVDTVTRDVENLKLDIDLKFESLSDDLTQELNNINNKLDLILNKLNILDDLENNLKQFINNIIIELKDFIKKTIQNEWDNLKQFINNTFNALYNYLELNIINQFGDLKRLLNKIFKSIEGLPNRLNRKFNNVIKKVNENTNNVKSNLRTYIFEQLTEQTIGLNTSFSVELESQLNLTIALLNGFFEAEIQGAVAEIKVVTNEAINAWYSENKNSIFSSSANYISERIVGESYIKYDGDNLYMPTLIFKYKNQMENEPRRYSQIKLRFNLKPDQITDEIVEALRLEILTISHYTYTAGPLRCIYISEKRLFKTTVFTESKDDIINLFKKIIPLTKTNFVENNISYTENSKRDHNIRKRLPLTGTNLNKPNFSKPCEMILGSVFLQINGLDRQIKLY